MKIILEFDDFHFLAPENCLEQIETLVTLYPNIVINLFTVANLRNVPMDQSPTWCSEVRELIQNGNLVLAYHGCNHDFLEFDNLDATEAKDKLLLAQNTFTKSNLPVVKVFRGPHWGLSSGTVRALADCGFTHVYNHDNYKWLDAEIVAA